MDNLNRREFLGAAATAGLLAHASSQGAQVTHKRKIGMIGCGGYGMNALRAAIKTERVEVIALCDVDSEHLQKAIAEVETLSGDRAKGFKDYRELLDTAGLEAVIIATPVHWHALPFIDACKKNLHIYCEKPLSYDVREGQAMVAAAKKSKGTIQIGFQRRQGEAIQDAAKYIRNGSGGKLVQVKAQIHLPLRVADTTLQDPPPSLDWDAWCGPAPKLPYRPSIGHFSWRYEEAYGNGHFADYGVHRIDAMRYVLGEKMPKSAQAAGGTYQLKGKINTPDVLAVHYEFETCPVTWEHRCWGAVEPTPEFINGVFFYFENETVFVDDQQWAVITPKGIEKKMTVSPESVSQMTFRHMRNFLESVEAGKQPLVTPEDAYQSTASVLLAIISYKLGRRIVWDAEKQQIKNDAEANALLKREYRKPWVHPA
jgi:predicted dehydrogenase